MTPETLASVPNQPKTKAYAVRIDDELRQAAMKRAEQDQDTFSDVVRKALTEYLADELLETPDE